MPVKSVSGGSSKLDFLTSPVTIAAVAITALCLRTVSSVVSRYLPRSYEGWRVGITEGISALCFILTAYGIAGNLANSPAGSSWRKRRTPEWAFYRHLVEGKGPDVQKMLQEREMNFHEEIEGKPLFHWLLLKGELSVIERTLEKYPLLIALENKQKEAPIHVAVQAKRADLIELLAKKGANLESRALGFTPLRLAEAMGYEEGVALLTRLKEDEKPRTT